MATLPQLRKRVSNFLVEKLIEGLGHTKWDITLDANNIAALNAIDWSKIIRSDDTKEMVIKKVARVFRNLKPAPKNKAGIWTWEGAVTEAVQSDDVLSKSMAGEFFLTEAVLAKLSSPNLAIILRERSHNFSRAISSPEKIIAFNDWLKDNYQNLNPDNLEAQMHELVGLDFVPRLPKVEAAEAEELPEAEGEDELRLIAPNLLDLNRNQLARIKTDVVLAKIENAALRDFLQIHQYDLSRLAPANIEDLNTTFNDLNNYRHAGISNLRQNKIANTLKSKLEAIFPALAPNLAGPRFPVLQQAPDLLLDHANGPRRLVTKAPYHLNDSHLNEKRFAPHYNFHSHSATEAILNNIENEAVREILRSLSVDLSDAIGLQNNIDNFNNHFKSIENYPVTKDALFIEVNKLLKHDRHSSLKSYDDSREAAEMLINTIHLSDAHQRHMKTEAVLANLDEPARSLLKARAYDLSTADATSIEIFNNWFRDITKHPIQKDDFNKEIQALVKTTQGVKFLNGAIIPDSDKLPADFVAAAKANAQRIVGETRHQQLLADLDKESLLKRIFTEPAAQTAMKAWLQDQLNIPPAAQNVFEAIARIKDPAPSDIQVQQELVALFPGMPANSFNTAITADGANTTVEAANLVGEARYQAFIARQEVVAQPILLSKLTCAPFAQLLKHHFSSDLPPVDLNDLNQQLAGSVDVNAARKNLAAALLGGAGRNTLDAHAASLGLQAADDHNLLIQEAKGAVAYAKFINSRELQAQPKLREKFVVPEIAKLLKQHWITHPVPNLITINQQLASANNVTEARRNLAQVLLNNRNALEVNAAVLYLEAEGQQNDLVKEAKGFVNLALLERDYPRLATWLNTNPQRLLQARENLSSLSESQTQALLNALAKALVTAQPDRAPDSSAVRAALIAGYDIEGQSLRLLNNAALSAEELTDNNAKEMQFELNGAAHLLTLEKDYPVLAAWINQNSARRAEVIINFEKLSNRQANDIFKKIANAVASAKNEANVREKLTPAYGFELKFLLNQGSALTDKDAVTEKYGLPNAIALGIKNEATGLVNLKLLNKNYAQLKELYDWINADPVRRAEARANLQSLTDNQTKALFTALKKAIADAPDKGAVRNILTNSYSGHKLLTTQLVDVANANVSNAVVISDDVVEKISGQIRYSKLHAELGNIENVPNLINLMSANKANIETYLGSIETPVTAAKLINDLIGAVNKEAANLIFQQKLGFDPGLDEAGFQALKGELQSRHGQAFVTAIIDKLPVEYINLRDWLKNEAAKHIVVPPARKAPLDIDAAVTALKNAHDLAALDTALKQLLALADDAAFPQATINLNRHAAVADARFYEILNNAEIQPKDAAVKRPVLLAGLNSNALLVKPRLAIPSEQPNYVNADTQLSILLNAASSFSQVKTALSTLGIAQDELAAKIIAENIMLTAAKLPEAHRADIRAFLNHAEIKLALQKNIERLAQAEPDKNLQDWLSNQLKILSDNRKTKVEIEAAVKELLLDSPAKLLNATQQKFVDEIHAANHPVKVLDNRLGLLFMRWVHSHPALAAEMEENTRHWTEADWQRRLPQIMQPLLDGSGQPPIVDQAAIDKFKRTLSEEHSVLGLFNHNLTPAEFSDETKNLLVGEARLNAWLNGKNPQFVKLLKNTQLDAVPGLAACSVWEELAKNLGEISEVNTAKERLEKFLENYSQVNLDAAGNGRAAADFWSALTAYVGDEQPLIDPRRMQPATLSAEQMQRLQAELILAKYEEKNPALIQWLRKNPAFLELFTSSLKNLPPNKIENLLSGISYILARFDLRKPSTFANFPSLFIEKVDEDGRALSPIGTLLDLLYPAETIDTKGNLQPNPSHAEALKMFGVNAVAEIPQIVLMPGVSPDGLTNTLSQQDLGFIINSSRTATAIEAIAISSSAVAPQINLESAIKELKLSRHTFKHPARFMLPEDAWGWGPAHSFREILQKQQENDQKLILQVVRAAVPVHDRTKDSKDPLAYALAMNAFTSLDAARRYFEKRLKDLREELIVSENIIHQISMLPNKVNDHEEIKRIKTKEAELQELLKEHIKIATKYLQTVDKAADQYAKNAQAAQEYFANHHGKLALYSTMHHKSGIVPDDANFNFNDPAVQNKLVSNEIPAPVQDAIQIAGDDKITDVEIVELKIGQRYVGVATMNDGSGEFGYSITKRPEAGYKMQVHQWPATNTDSSIFKTLFAWFKQTNTADAAALDLWADRLIELSNATRKQDRTSSATIILDGLNARDLAKLLPVLYAKIEVQVYNGGRRIPVIYDAEVNSSNIIKQAEKIAQVLIKNKEPHRPNQALDVNISKIDKMVESLNNDDSKANEAIGRRVGGPRG